MCSTNPIKTLAFYHWVFLAPSSRTAGYLIIMLPLILLCLYLALILGPHELHGSKLITVLSGEGNSFENFILFQLRLPSALVAIGAGATLAISGSIFQTTTGNTLGSPDIIGITAGASAGLVIALVLCPGYLPIPIGAFLGACGAVILVCAGSLSNINNPTRIVISGIAVSAICMATVNFAISQVRLEHAHQITSLLSGSLAQKNWRDVVIINLTLLIAIPFLAWLSRQLDYLNFGIDIANTIGINTRLVQWFSLLLAVILATSAVLVVGPVAFIALSAPQISKHITRAKGANLLCCAFMGALMLLVSYIITLLLPTPSRLPVGVITAAIGGVYLMYLLYAEIRRIK